MSKMLKIAKDFTRTPGPRYIKEGRFSGEQFRESFLKPAIEHAINGSYRLLVDLDGTAGYGTSFLEESFGGLIREDKLDYEQIIKHIVLSSFEEEYLKDDIAEYLRDAHQQSIGKLGK
ncbi:STAS-like domain-containing protein [Dyadobacter sp. MSC1_007]|jgi:hypothetical protein|uniref:STAS-like domain-containing protein n=1 Tax=Dyadobacter sp. MSC1_007 TaxID=2909264 RepID=UPI00202E0FE6|nr:STAS-like domain-containing protein [Dyadobacter sp. MSC1_007]